MLEATVYPEEVTHCAAGVRWLTWLHRRAHAAAVVPADGSTAAATTAGSISAAAPETDTPAAVDPSVDDILAMADDLNQQCSVEHDALQDAERRVGQQTYCACCGPGAPDTGEVMSRTAIHEADAETAQAWISDALQFDTVELWFHALVKRHFFGALKGPFNEVARHEAGLLPGWYLPLAAP